MKVIELDVWAVVSLPVAGEVTAHASKSMKSIRVRKTRCVAMCA